MPGIPFHAFFGHRITYDRLVRVLGIGAGLAVACLLLATGDVRPRDADFPAGVTIRAVATGELGISKQRALVAAPRLRPGGTPRGAFGATTVSNLTGKAMAVQVRVVSEGRDLEELVHARVTIGDRLLAKGTLAQLRSWSEQRYVLPIGGKRKLRVIAWLPHDSDRYQGLTAAARLELRARGAGGGR